MSDRTTDDVLADARNIFNGTLADLRGDIKVMEGHSAREKWDLEMGQKKVQRRADDMQQAADDLQALIDEYEQLTK
jgi:hypothetical protein